MVADLNFSHYRPTPDTRRFSISNFAVAGTLRWEAKPGGEFAARVEVIKGAFAKMIPFTAIEASVRIIAEGSKTRKEFLEKIFGGRGTDSSDAPTERRKSWDDLGVISAIEIPWVAEYQLQRWSVGGEQETRFRFEDNQREREAILYFREDSTAGAGDAMAILRVLKPGDLAESIATPKASPETKPGDVLITFRNSQVQGFTVFVPLIGKLQFVSEPLA